MNLAILLVAAALSSGSGRSDDDPGVVSGFVHDEAGAPLVGADVRLTRLDRDLGPLSYSSMRATLSKADGSFRFEKVATSTWLIDARDAKRYLAQPVRIVVTREKFAIERVDLALSPAGAVEGIVTDESGRPLEGVGVAVGDGGMQGQGIAPVTMSDFATGTVMKLPEGTSYPRLPLKMALTAADGRFRLSPILPEIATSLRVGGLAAFHDVTVSGVFAPPGGAAFVEIALRRGAAVTGRVLRQDGRPVASARVTLLLLETTPRQDSWIVLPRAAAEAPFGVEARHLITATEGLFRFEGLGAARYLIIAEAEGLARASSSMLVLTRDGEVMPLEVTLPEGATIEGRLADPHRAGVEGIVVEAALQPGSSDAHARSGIEPFLPPLRTTVRADGTFCVRVPSHGPYTMRVTCPGLPPLVIDNLTPGDGSSGAPALVVARGRHSFTIESDPRAVASATPPAR